MSSSIWTTLLFQCRCFLTVGGFQHCNFRVMTQLKMLLCIFTFSRCFECENVNFQNQLHNHEWQGYNLNLAPYLTFKDKGNLPEENGVWSSSRNEKRYPSFFISELGFEQRTSGSPSLCAHHEPCWLPLAGLFGYFKYYSSMSSEWRWHKVVGSWVFLIRQSGNTAPMWRHDPCSS